MNGPLFYPGKIHGYLNGRTFLPEAVDGRCMVNPFYPNLLDVGGVGLPLLPGARAICDSQAFQTWKTRTPGKRTKRERMTADEAIDAQLAFRARLRAELGDPAFDFEGVVTYDKLVDEAVVNGKQVKRRAAEVDAVAMVAETIAAARVYQARRDEFGGAIAYAAQGATLDQYMDCVRQLLPLMRPGKDWLALGGFCIIGQQRSLIPLFIEVCREVAPLLARHGITRVHVLGVTVVEALQYASAVFAEHGIVLSTDSASMEVNALRGREWHVDHMLARPGASPFAHRFTADEKLSGYHPRDLSILNIERFTAWLREQGGTARHRRHITYQPDRQIALFGVL